MSLLGSSLDPCQPLLVVLGDSPSHGVDRTEEILCLDVPLLRRLVEPLASLFGVREHALAAAGVERAERGLGLGVPLLCGLSIPLHGSTVVYGDALALLVDRSQLELGSEVPELRRLLVPDHRFRGVPGRARTRVVDRGQLEAGLEMALFCGLAEPLRRLGRALLGWVGRAQAQGQGELRFRVAGARAQSLSILGIAPEPQRHRQGEEQGCDAGATSLGESPHGSSPFARSGPGSSSGVLSYRGVKFATSGPRLQALAIQSETLRTVPMSSGARVSPS